MAEVIVSVPYHAGVDIRSTWFVVFSSLNAGAFWQSGADVFTDDPTIMADGVLKIWISFADSHKIGSANSPETCGKTNLSHMLVLEQRRTPIIADISDSRWIMISIWAVFVIVNTADSPEHVVLVLDALCLIACMVTMVSMVIVIVKICDIYA